MPFEHASEKPLKFRRLRMSKKGCTGSGFDDSSLMKKSCRIAGSACEAHLMGDNHEFDAFTAQLCGEIEHFRRVLGIQCRGGFIEQQQLRSRSHRTGDGSTLLLSAGQFGGVLIGMFGKAEMRQKLKSPSISRLLCPSMYLPQHQGNIFGSSEISGQPLLKK